MNLIEDIQMSVHQQNVCAYLKDKYNLSYIKFINEFCLTKKPSVELSYIDDTGVHMQRFYSQTVHFSKSGISYGYDIEPILKQTLNGGYYLDSVAMLKKLEYAIHQEFLS